MYLLSTFVFFIIFVVFTIGYITVYSLWSLVEFLFNNTVGKLFQ